MQRIREGDALVQLAAVVSEALTEAGIVATLSGGSVVTIYTDNEFLSKDLDFVTASMLDELGPVMEELGFEHTGTPRLSVFTHPLVEWYVEFVPAPLTFGNLFANPAECATIETHAGKLRIISATQCVMDRLAADFAWGDPQSRAQAIRVAVSNDIDWAALRSWFVGEGKSEGEFEQFETAVARARGTGA
jgi:hypothetical protein